MKNKVTLLLILGFTHFFLVAQEKERELSSENYRKYKNQAEQVRDYKKEQSIEEFRKSFAKMPYRYHELNSLKMTAHECWSLLTEDGQFLDLKESEDKIMNEKMLLSRYSVQSGVIAQLVSQSYLRLWRIADAVRKGEMNQQEVFTEKYLKALIRYGKIETGRNNESPRFHASCFLIPTSAVNIYYAFLMKRIKM